MNINNATYESLIAETYTLTQKIGDHKQNFNPDLPECECMDKAIKQLYLGALSLTAAKHHTDDRLQLRDVLDRVECGTSTATDADYLREVLA